MKKTILLIVQSLILFPTLFAQKGGQFYAEISTDTVDLDGYVEVSFIIENIDGEFEAPEFANFQVMSGPNTSMSMSIVNNKMTRSSKYSYIIKPLNVGRFFIEPAYLISDDENYETEPIEIIVNYGSDGKPKASKITKKSAKSKTANEPSESISSKRQRKKL